MMLTCLRRRNQTTPEEEKGDRGSVQVYLGKLHRKIEDMDYHLSEGKHGEEETKAILEATWEDVAFRGLAALTEGFMVSTLMVSGLEALKVDKDGFYVVHLKKYHNYKVAETPFLRSIGIDRDINAVAGEFKPTEVRKALLDYLGVF